MLLTKEANEGADFQNFDCLHENSPNHFFIFSSHESIFFQIFHHPSVSWHIISLIFSGWNMICCGQEEPMNVQFFRLLSAPMKVHPILHAILNRKVRDHSKFASLFSVMKDNSSVFSLLKLYILWTKEILFKWNFRIFSGRMKFHQIPHVIFETTSQFYFKISITLQCNERKLFYTFSPETSYDVEKGIMQNLNKSQFLVSKITKI